LFIGKPTSYADCTFDFTISDNWQTAVPANVGKPLSYRDPSPRMKWEIINPTPTRAAALGCGNRFSD